MDFFLFPLHRRRWSSLAWSFPFLFWPQRFELSTPSFSFIDIEWRSSLFSFFLSLLFTFNVLWRGGRGRRRSCPSFRTSFFFSFRNRELLAVPFFWAGKAATFFSSTFSPLNLGWPGLPSPPFFFFPPPPFYFSRDCEIGTFLLELAASSFSCTELAAPPLPFPAYTFLSQSCEQ